MKSIITTDNERCFVCGAPAAEEHHIFGGPNRKNSERYGLKVRLCHWCHNEPPNGAHFCTETDLYLKRTAQVKFEMLHGHDKFMQVIGKNYL